MIDERARQTLLTVAAIVALGVAIGLLGQSLHTGAALDRRRRRDANDLAAANDELRARVRRLEEERPIADHEETQRREPARDHSGERGEP